MTVCLMWQPFVNLLVCTSPFSTWVFACMSMDILFSLWNYLLFIVDCFSSLSHCHITSVCMCDYVCILSSLPSLVLLIWLLYLLFSFKANFLFLLQNTVIIDCIALRTEFFHLKYWLTYRKRKWIEIIIST